MSTNVTFCYGPPSMVFGPGVTTDANGQVTVQSGSAGGVNAGAVCANLLKAGLLPAAPKTTGFNTAVTAATTAIAAVAASPTQAEIQAALTAVLSAVSALTSA